jgi:hypothetical protein
VHSLERDPRFNSFSLSDGYLDIVGVLTVEEARQIDSERGVSGEPDRRLGRILSDESLNTSFVLVWIWELDISDAADGIAQEAHAADTFSPLALRLIRSLAAESLGQLFPSRSAAFCHEAKAWLAELRNCAAQESLPADDYEYYP